MISKKLPPRRREELFLQISSSALCVGVGIVHHGEIDRINILQATMKAMRYAVHELSVTPDHLLVDGPRYDDGNIPYTGVIIDGDAKCFSIAAASIIAKVTRDRLMVEYDRLYPEYGFARHKGYGTAVYLAALRAYNA